MLRWRPNPTRSPGPLQRSFESYCGRWSDSMSFDEVWKEVGLSENGLSMNIPNLIPHWQCCCHFQTRVCSRLQTLPRIQSFPISASGPREILHADFSSVRLILCHEGCLFRQNPSILLRMFFYLQWTIWQGRIWKIWCLKLNHLDINSGFMSTLD